MTMLRPLALSAARQFASVAVHIVSIAAISRLLTPEQIGTFAVAAAFTKLAGMVRDFGLTDFIIQSSPLTVERRRAAQAATLAISWALAGVVLLAAPVVAGFYRMPQITEVLQLQALGFMLIPFGAVTMAWLRRDMRLLPIFVIGTLSDLAAAAAAIGCALAGQGALSLAWASLAGIAVSVVATWMLRPSDWDRWPRWPGWASVREALAFGSWTGGVNLLMQLGRSAPELLMGRWADLASVALFNRAGSLAGLSHQLSNGVVQPLILPYLAQDLRTHGASTRPYLATVTRLTALAWPVLAFLGLNAPAVIALYHGPQWSASVSLARLLCAAAAIEMVHRFAREALMARGSAREAGLMGLRWQALQVLGVVTLLPWGVEGACWGLLAATAIGTWAQQRDLARQIGLTTRAMWLACRPSAWVTACSALPVVLLRVALGPANQDSPAALGAAALLGAAGWWLGLRLCRHPLAAEIDTALRSVRRN
jgi:O-antigen/teichoic acid export membrane protein